MCAQWRASLAAAASLAWNTISAVLLCTVFFLLSCLVRLALWPVNAEFAGPICAMALVFLAMVTFGILMSGTECFYRAHLMDRINFINKNLGLSFTVPLIMINDGRNLHSSDIGKVIATSAITNAISWPMVFLMAISWQLLLTGYQTQRRTGLLYRIRDTISCKFSQRQETQSVPLSGQRSPETPTVLSLSDMSLPTRPQSPMLAHEVTGAAAVSCPMLASFEGVRDSRSRLSTTSSDIASPDTPSPTPGATPKAETAFDLDVAPYPRRSSVRESLPQRIKLFFSKVNIGGRARIFVATQPHLTFVALVIVTIALPLSATIREDRPLDFGFLCFFWISTNDLQTALQPTGAWTQRRKRLALAANMLATLINPVLITTGCMMAYTQAKARIRHDAGLTETLATFSSHTSATALLSYYAGIRPLPKGKRDWFGAGDLALALLDCGIVAWGFKLYECRRQLLSRAGLAAVATSACAAVFNVFVSTLIARRGVGLAAPEALAFAARSTTLALSRPAMDALDGNTVVNAALVVTNGIIGQWIYPLMPRLLGVPADDENGGGAGGKRGSSSSLMVDLELDPARANNPPDSTTITPAQNSSSSSARNERNDRDDAADPDVPVGPIVSAAGVTAGVNGAAMGVAYLYSRNAGSAPFAALTMTIFGVMTVIVTCAGPFPEILKSLAR